VSNSGLVKVEVIDRIIFSRWGAPPSREDAATMLKIMAEAHQRLGMPFVYVAAVESKSKVADQSQRALLNEMLLDGRKYVNRCFMIIEGTDLQHNLQRVIFSGIIIVTRTFGDFLQVAKSGEAITADVSKLLGKDTAPLFQQAREAGLIAK